jgi:4a-hydroxytetrahydrobiopterin dehydratase
MVTSGKESAGPEARDEARNRVARELPGWRTAGEVLVGKWRFKDFAEALVATNRVGALAEKAGHHPDIAFGWGYLEVRLTTHDAGAITAKDVDLAGGIQAVLGHPE